MSARQKAIRCASGYVAQYRAALRIPRLPENIVGAYHERITALTREIATMQTAGDEGERLARAWCKVAAL